VNANLPASFAGHSVHLRHIFATAITGLQNWSHCNREQGEMSSKSPKIMPLAAALTALTGASVFVATPADAKNTEQQGVNPSDASQATSLAPNRIVSVGEDFLGFLVTKAADGLVVADHTSHYSHSSHYSGR
jgi:hypothetical protein